MSKPWTETNSSSLTPDSSIRLSLGWGVVDLKLPSNNNLLGLSQQFSTKSNSYGGEDLFEKGGNTCWKI